ncbi:MAG TPA: Rieske (2Fe-2S) protein [Candidatus Dormibacteraeota bacterium]|jgi:nitrite reductase/ring-hydroxylating ferredoxin subunit|nr:Rieske (2Fe-2S) protein [Candidatus Dormibacteraeota bacterium]
MHNTELSLTDLAENSPVCIEHDGSKVLVIRSGGRVFAYEDRCPHAFWPLSQGTVAGPIIECPGHGWQFDVETGRCLTSPAYCLKSVPSTVEGGTIVLQREEKSATDSSATVSHACS